MPKALAAIGYTIPGHDKLTVPFRSAKALMDADIILFSPTLPHYQLSEAGNGAYLGKTCYGESGSFQLKADMSHWRRELQSAFDSGKTVYFLLDTKDDFFVDSGDRSYSGTGRNRKTTIQVANATNYEVIPAKIGNIQSAHGIEVISTGHPLFKQFTQYFKPYLEYRLYIQGLQNGTVLFTGKDKTKILGAYLTIGPGHLVLLPYIKYDENDFTEKRTDKKDGTVKHYWTKKALEFGNALVSNLVAIDTELTSSSEKTPPPTWVDKQKYKNKEEIKVNAEVKQKQDLIATTQNQIADLYESLERVQVLKALLFEQGKPLERGVIAALRLLGFTAENYDDGTLELDQVIISPEGNRYIGECEGKDEKDIDISKFRQLLESMSADFDRDEVTEKAFGILFGNPQRLTEPQNRTLDFTQKCKIGATREKIALIKTVDLYEVAAYLDENEDENFQLACRNAIHSGLGNVVVFPPLPVNPSSNE